MAQRHRILDANEGTRTGTCSVCGPVDLYRTTSRGYVNWRCAPLARTTALDRSRTPEGQAAYRDRRFQQTYGISLAEYDAMVEEQQGKCARCGDTPKTLRLAVDHCHDTGKVRKLLCGPCNTYLGRLAANLDRLEADIMYLRTGAFADVIVKALTD